MGIRKDFLPLVIVVDMHLIVLKNHVKNVNVCGVTVIIVELLFKGQLWKQINIKGLYEIY